MVTWQWLCLTLCHGAMDNCSQPVHPCEGSTLQMYIESVGGEVPDKEDWCPFIVRWATISTPLAEYLPPSSSRVSSAQLNGPLYSNYVSGSRCLAS
jgi:hypothetical protein